MLKNKRILITGGLGFIGSWLTESFAQKNEITIFDNGRRNAIRFLPKSITQKISIIQGDILNPKAVKKATINQDIIIHLAAIAGVSSYEKDPLLTIRVNLFGTENLLNNLLHTNATHVIIFSSSEVYGQNAINVTELDSTCIGPPSESRWSYATSKIAGEHLAFAYYKKHELPITIVRPFNIYGPRQIGEGAIANMIISCLKDKQIFISGDGKQKRSWCYISDLVRSIESIIERKIVGQCFNIGNPREHFSIIDLAKKIQQLLPKVKFHYIEAKKSEINDRLPNIDMARRYFSFSPKINLNEGLKLSINWYQKNLDHV